MLDRDGVVGQRLHNAPELAQNGSAGGLVRRFNERAPQKLDRGVEVTAPERRPEPTF